MNNKQDVKMIHNPKINMNTKRFIHIAVFCLISIICKGQIHDKIKTDKIDFTFEKFNEFDKINSKYEYKIFDEGHPELPYIRVSYVLPLEAEFTGITFSIKDKSLLKAEAYINPVQKKRPVSIYVNNDTVEPNEKIYKSDNAFPGKLFDIESDIFFQGYHVVTLRIYPVEYLPKSKILNYYSSLEYTIQYSNVRNNGLLRPQFQSLLRYNQCKYQVMSLVNNPKDVESFGGDANFIVSGKTVVKSNVSSSDGRKKTKAISIQDEIIPDYIIITNNSLRESFQLLANWKTKKGVFTLVKTVEEINNDYSGSDLQEKIRSYLIEAYYKWGAGLYVLLGGDVNIVPPRIVASVYYNNQYFPADMYYATYIGTWNANNNNKFNEGSDGTNYSTGNIIGRAPVENVSEANTFVNKVITYEKATNISDLNYFKNNLIADAYLGPTYVTPSTPLSSSYHNSINSDCNSYIPSTLNTKFMCDNASCNGSVSRYTLSPCIGGNIELNRDNFISALNTGADMGVGKFHFIYHEDHGSSQGIGISGKDKGQGVSKVDMGGLTNGTNYQILMTGSCSSANFNDDCIAEHYLTNPNGGGVAWIGNTDVGFFGESDQLKYFCSSVYGTGSLNTGRYDIGSAFQNIIKRQYTKNWRLHLLGDPEMQVWTNTPQSLSVLTSPSALLLGDGIVNVTISNLPSGEKAVICIRKDTEIYLTREIATNGTYAFNLTSNTVGNVDITVTAHNFVPYENTIQVNSSTDPNPYVESVNFIDSGSGIGDGNGKNDAGESIQLELSIKNSGINTANSIIGKISSNSQFIVVNNDTYNYGNITSGNSVLGYYLYTINKDAPEILTNSSNPVQFTVEIKDQDNITWLKTFNIDVFNCNIVQRNKTILTTGNGDLIIDPNETVSFNIDLQNVGKALGKNITAVLTSNSGSDIIQSCSASTIYYPDISPFECKTNNTPFTFITGPAYTSSSPLNFDLQITNEYGKTWNYQFNLKERPASVIGVDFTSDVDKIDLYWTPQTGVAGYNIYRCDVGLNDSESGNYIKINNAPFISAFYNDKESLNPLTKYYYKITAVSMTGNESLATRILTWTSYPKKNLFPVTLDASLSNFSTSINTADTDLDGKKEIFIGTKGGNDKGFIVGLNHYGNELYDIDNNVTTKSGFAKLGFEAWAIPAIGDLKRIGKPLIIEATRNYQQDNALFCFAVDDNNPIDNKPDLLWTTPTPQKQHLRGPIVANIDNSIDGSMEVITCSDERGNISIYDSNGTLIQDISCLNTYGAISVADIDNNGDKEIIQASGTGIHVWHHDGTSYLNMSALYNLTLSGYRFVTSVVVCDIDNDGTKEIVTFALRSSAPYYAKLFAIKNDGTLVSGFDGTQTITTSSNWAQELAVGDLNNDGNIEIVAFANDGIKIWNNSAQLIKTIALTDIAVAGQPILADVDGDLNAEIICSSASNSNIYAFKIDGANVVGFPLRGTLGKCGGINISDVDNDGKNELLAVNSNRIEMWQTDGISTRIEWGSERHDQYNTGEYQTTCEPVIINSNTSWSTDQTLCGDLIVNSGTLNISNCNISMSLSSMIIIKNDANLVIDGANINNANIKVLEGGSIKLQNNGRIVLNLNGQLYSEIGSVIEIISGVIDK